MVVVPCVTLGEKCENDSNCLLNSGHVCPHMTINKGEKMGGGPADSSVPSINPEDVKPEHPH